MTDNPNLMAPAELKAFMQSNGSWGQWGSSEHHARYAKPIKSRRRCHCCNRRTTHAGMCNGVSMTSGCEACVAKWVGPVKPSLRIAQ
jgi:hypothetical protein